MGRIKFGVYKAPNTSGKEQQSCARLISKGTMRMEVFANTSRIRAR